MINADGRRVVYARALLGWREHYALLSPTRSTLCGRPVAEHSLEPLNRTAPIPLPCVRCRYQLGRGGRIGRTLIGRWWRLLARLAGGRGG